MTTTTPLPRSLTRKDLATDLDPRWCPGCGDYAILAQMQKIIPELGIPRENIVFVSGIGCSSRFPYYMNTYGIHSIHGRAPTLGTGIKATNPDLSVWVITGDGDGLAIGGNHLVHVLRRNVDINIVLFNNRIYGLTKGQYSPTSMPGHQTRSSPMGSIEQSFNPISVSIGAEATFVALTVDRFTRHMAEVLQRAAWHKGTSFVEVLQNCALFNDGAWSEITDPAHKDDKALFLEHGKPLIFGKDRDKGIRLNGLRPEVVDLGDSVSEDDLLIHDEGAEPPALAYLLSRMNFTECPMPLGVLRCVEQPTYEGQLIGQEDTAIEQLGEGELDALFHKGETWDVAADEEMIS